MNDMRAVIVPRSDQINADDLLAGPITVTVTAVSIKAGSEQPVSISFEGDNGKPYRPCKSMCRVLVHCWGPDASHYKGRSMTLYCDPKVKWGGLAVGGIRISHMTDINGTQIMALTETKGSKKPFTVQPLVLATAKRQTTSEWIAAVNADLEDATTSDEVAAIVAREDVQTALERFKPASLETLKQRIAIAEVRVAPPTGAEPPIDDGSAATDESDIFPPDRASKAAA